MRRRKLNSILYDNYPLLNEDEKDAAQEMVFSYYDDRNDSDLDVALSEIEGDIARLEQVEQYERCAMLKDILERFE